MKNLGYWPLNSLTEGKKAGFPIQNVNLDPEDVIFYLVPLTRQRIPYYYTVCNKVQFGWVPS